MIVPFKRGYHGLCLSTGFDHTQLVVFAKSCSQACVTPPVKSLSSLAALPSIRGGALQTSSHLREDLVEADQTPQCGPGAQV